MNEAEITIVRADKTCIACPAQWDAWDSTGQYWYLRYRFGKGTATAYADESWVDDPEARFDIWGRLPNQRFFRYGHEMDGSMELREFCERIGFKLALEED